jgi:hypothetical protein
MYIFLESWLILFSPSYVFMWKILEFVLTLLCSHQILCSLLHIFVLYYLLLNKLLHTFRGNIFLFFLILV